MPQDQIHDTPVARVLMATSSSTTFGGPPSPLEKAIRNSSTNQNLKHEKIGRAATDFSFKC